MPLPLFSLLTPLRHLFTPLLAPCYAYCHAAFAIIDTADYADAMPITPLPYFAMLPF